MTEYVILFTALYYHNTGSIQTELTCPIGFFKVYQKHSVRGCLLSVPI